METEEVQSENESLNEETSDVEEQETFQQDALRSVQHYSEALEIPESKELDKNVGHHFI